MSNKEKIISKRALGAWGEAVAGQFLERHGYEILQRNYQARHKELDIVARRGETLCFIEVKLRREESGGAERATGRVKLERLQSAARTYCLRKGINLWAVSISFEQVSVYLSRNRSSARCVRYILL